MIPPAKRGGRKRSVEPREIVNGLMYVLSTGWQWRYVPKDLPPKSTLFGYFDLWNWDGTLDRIHHALYVKCREAMDREESPAIYEGATRSEAAKIGGVTLQIVRDWVVKFNAHGPEGLIDRKAPGQPARLNDTHRAALAEIIESGPMPAVHGVVRWRLIDLCQWIFEEFRLTIAKQTLSRELRSNGLSQAFRSPAPSCASRGRRCGF